MKINNNYKKLSKMSMHDNYKRKQFKSNLNNNNVNKLSLNNIYNQRSKCVNKVSKILCIIFCPKFDIRIVKY